MPKMTPVSCKYGAPMGRASFGTPAQCAPRELRELIQLPGFTITARDYRELLKHKEV